MTSSGERRFAACFRPVLVVTCVAAGTLSSGLAAPATAGATSPAATAAASIKASAPRSPVSSDTPVGAQLSWFLNAVNTTPLSRLVVDAHFDSVFLAKFTTMDINSDLAKFKSSRTPVIVKLLVQEAQFVKADVLFGDAEYAVSISVDGAGLISGLLLSSVQPSSAACAAQNAADHCYTPLQLEHAYDLDPLYAKGLNGSGITIVVLAASVIPSTLEHELAVFDDAFHLPTARIHFVAPTGTMAEYSGAEVTLDVEAVHAIAPGARIVVLAAPLSASTAGGSQVSWVASAVRYAAQHRLGQVVTTSLGEVGETGLGTATIDGLHKEFQYAADRHISVIVASGDFGASSRLPASTGGHGAGCCFTEQIRGYPASDPLVTAVGATRLHLDAGGNRISPDVVASDRGKGFASGGGLSTTFDRPKYQDTVESVVGDRRGGPDVSMSGNAPYGGFEVYYSEGNGPASAAGWVSVGGTSESAPLFAGVAAIADEAAGHPLGPLNPLLYRAYQLSGHGGIVPVTSGDTTVTLQSKSGTDVTVPGYHAAPGYNLATGLGTVDAAKLVMTLAQLAQQ